MTYMIFNKETKVCEATVNTYEEMIKYIDSKNGMIINGFDLEDSTEAIWYRVER